LLEKLARETHKSATTTLDSVQVGGSAQEGASVQEEVLVLEVVLVQEGDSVVVVD